METNDYDIQRRERQTAHMLPVQQMPNQQFFPIANNQKVSRLQRNTEGVIIGRAREPLIQQQPQDLSHQSSQQRIKIFSL